MIELAVEEARRLGHHYIGTEHLLLGLIREGEGIAAGVLESLGVNLKEVRTEVVKVVSVGPSPRTYGTMSSPGIERLLALPRIGYGFDVHRLVADRELRLGGVHVPYHLGLQGHSDADVLVHAIIDALLGAAGLNDIGHYFPNHDPRWQGVSSLDLLSKTRAELQQHGYLVGNIDSTVVAEEPKLAPFITEMRTNIAERLRIDTSNVGIKATTAEGTGPEGRGESITARAVALIVGMRET